MSKLNDVITYGNAKFRVVKNITSENLNYFNDLPVGTILSFLGNSNTPPATYLFCDGSAISRTMYSDLFSILGTTYGIGDGETTFNLPNLTGKFLEGALTAGINKDAGLPNITGEVGSVMVYGNTSSGPFYRSYSSGITFGSSGAGDGYQIDFDISRANTIYGNSTTVQPSSITVRYIIKAFNEQTFESSLIDVTQYASDLATRLQRQQIPAFNKLVKITTSQTWSAPVTGWYKFTIKGAGGGGGKGYRSGNLHCGGAGGGEGGTSFVYAKLSQGDTVAMTIGAGGATQTTGGNTSCVINGITYTAYGGEAGFTTNGAIGGRGGRGGAGDLHGIPGCSTIRISTDLGVTGGSGGGVGGGSGASIWGSGVQDGIDGGGGGGGSTPMNDSSNAYYAGGKGGNGVVWIEYFDPTLN